MTKATVPDIIPINRPDNDSTIIVYTFQPNVEMRRYIKLAYAKRWFIYP
jgi:hypothetical protein